MGRVRAVLVVLVVALTSLTVAGAYVEGRPASRGHVAPPAATAPAATAPADVGGGHSLPPPASSPGKPPNIVVVMLDDLRADELRFAPNARRYVRDRGLDFRNSFSPYPLCCPARASFLVGRYAHNHRVLYHDAPYGFGSFDDRRTLAGRLQAAGYRTALVGKYLNRYGEQPSRVTGQPSTHYVPRGWTDWMVGLETPWPAGSPYAGNTYDYFNFTQNVNGQVVANPGRYSSSVIGEQVRRLIGKYHRADRPFFLWVTPVAPHHGLPLEPDDPAPYLQSTGYVQQFLTPARPAWVKGRFDQEISHAPGQPTGWPAEADVSDKPRNIRKWPETTPTEQERLRDVARQRAESIYAWDVELGKIVQRLKRTGEYDDTVLVFTSDNGYYLGEHRQRLGKIKAHEPSLRVPLVVAGPGIATGVRYHPTTTLDLTATVLDLAGARPLPQLEGGSLVPLFSGPDQPWTVPVVTEGLIKDVRRRARSGVPAGLTTSGLRLGRYKLIRYSNGEGELYDLRTDPNELTSLWADPDHRDLRRELERVWARYRSCRGAACRTELPAALQVSVEDLRSQDRNARQQVRKHYRPWQD